MRQKQPMNIREKLEFREHEILSSYASFSDSSLGRDWYEEPCDIRMVYQRDRDRILHCKAFRRLKQKTQVFLLPEGDHYRTRLTHTLEVSQNARTIAKALRLNEDLTEAIALGHDLGHTPFGHAGERALNKICTGGFHHHLQSIRIVELLERDGRGLNLTMEVRDGIKSHPTSENPSTLEGKIVRLSDKIAYINSDIDDAIRAKIIKEDDIPEIYTKVLGNSLRNRVNNIIHDIIMQSDGQNDIRMSEPIQDALNGLRNFMFERVYTNPMAKGQEAKAENLIVWLFEHYIRHFDMIPNEFRKMVDDMGESKERIVCDYIACMTDRYAIAIFKNLMIPQEWTVL